MLHTCHNQYRCANCNCNYFEDLNIQIDRTYKLMSIAVLYKQYLKEAIAIHPEHDALALIAHHATEEAMKLSKMFK